MPMHCGGSNEVWFAISRFAVIVTLTTVTAKSVIPYPERV